MKKLRPLQFVIHPAVLADDGENLEPVQVAPITVPASEMSDWYESFMGQLAEEEQKLENEAEDK